MKWFITNIKSELLIWFILLSIVPIIVLSIIHFIYQYNQYITTTKDRLDFVVDYKIKEFDSYIKNRKDEIKTVSKMPTLVEAFAYYNDYFSKSKDGDKSINQYSKFFANLKIQKKFYDIFLINLSGDIIYALKQEADLGTNLIRGSYSQTELANVFNTSIKLLDTEMSQFEFYLPSKKLASFIASPILYNGSLIGVVAIQLSSDDIFDILLECDKLGDSGEVIAGRLENGIDAITITPPKFNNNQTYYYRYNDGYNPPILKALNGEKGFEEVNDYRGVRTYQSYRYLPSLKWGIVAKIDKKEALEPLYNSAYYTFLIIFFLIIAILVVFMLAIKHIVTPIHQLQSKIDGLLMGKKLSIKLDVSNEIGKVDKAFDEIFNKLSLEIDLLKTEHVKLEDKLKNRDKEVQTLKEKLLELNQISQNRSLILNKYVISSSTNEKGIITDVSEAFCKVTGHSKSELIGRTHNILRHPNMTKELYKDLWRTIKNGNSWEGEIENIKKDGSSYWLYTIITPIFNSKGIITGYSSIREDITHKKALEELLKSKF